MYTNYLFKSDIKLFWEFLFMYFLCTNRTIIYLMVTKDNPFVIPEPLKDLGSAIIRGLSFKDYIFTWKSI